MTPFARVGVVGAGTMGSGIAQIVAQAGSDVVMVARRRESLDAGLAAIERSLSRFVAKGVLSDRAAADARRRISPTTERARVADAELVIESISEDLAAKRELYLELDRICDRATVFASNTSSLPISDLARATTRPERMIGLHFFNPAQLMEGVEVVVTPQLAADVRDRCVGLIRALGKKPILIRDGYGLLTTRIINPYFNEAIHLVGEGQDPTSIDAAMVTCFKMPIGPCALMDLIGLDVVLHALEGLAEVYGARYEPAPHLRAMVREGRLGRKSGRGFFEYGAPGPAKK